MKKSKILLFLACVAATLTFVGCKEKEKPLEEPKENVVSFRTEQCELIIGDEFMLDVRYELDESQSFVFASSDESVVTVDENGELHALASGSATVTVTYGTASDECAVTVGMGTHIPLLQYKGIDETLRITTSDVITLNPSVFFNGKNYQDAQVSYTLSDETVGKVENGVFTPAKIGKVDIYASATWRGVTGETLTKNISVEIIKDIQMFVNNGQDSSFVLYTLDDSKVPVTAGALENGKVIDDVSLELVSGEKYVDFSNGKISSKGLAGTAELKMYCNDSEGDYWEKIIPVTVTQTVLPYEGEEIFNFSAMDGEVVGSKTIGQSIGGRIVRAQDANGNELEVKDGRILGVEMGGGGESEVTLTAFTSRVGYTMKVKGYSGIFDEAEDLKFFGVHNENYKTHPSYDEEVDKYDRGYTFLMAKQEGYYVLANNIDATGYVQPNGGKDLSSALQTMAKDYIDPVGGVGLKGTLDGRGYTIRGLTVGTYGLFGIISGGTIKNIAFTDVKFTEKGTSGLMGQYVMDATLQNVYIQAERINSGGLISSMMEGVFMSGCLFELPQETCAANNYGSITYWGGRLVMAHASLKLNGFNGVYVISPLVLARYSSEKTTYTIDGSNREGSTYLFEGVNRYDTAADMAAAYTGANEYEQFSNLYWDKSGSIPVWKTKDFVIDDTVERDEIFGGFNTDWVQ